MAKKRSLEYEKKFKSYIFNGDSSGDATWERYIAITKNLEAVPSINETREAFRQWEEKQHNWVSRRLEDDPKPSKKKKGRKLI